MDLEPIIKSIIVKSGARFGVSLRHIERDEEILVNGNRYFPMASVFKIPILVEAYFGLAEEQNKPTDRMDEITVAACQALS